MNHAIVLHPGDPVPLEVVVAAAITREDPRKYLVWSNEHRMWWAPSERGYTPIIDEAGRFTLSDGMAICRKATLDGELSMKAESHVHPGRVWDVLPEQLVLSPEALAASLVHLVLHQDNNASSDPEEDTPCQQ
jgi:hypothetical protein